MSVVLVYFQHHTQYQVSQSDLDTALHLAWGIRDTGTGVVQCIIVDNRVIAGAKLDQFLDNLHQQEDK